jgi:hypothetical protein
VRDYTPALQGAYLFAAAFVLAHLEIQIEGPRGWAAGLPTWRWESPAILRWLGKPVTGYHVFLNLLILLFLHAPVVRSGFSFREDASIFSSYFLLAVTWDFLWFACNPHFGLRRLNPEHAWWFKTWTLGLPRAYFGGVLLSMGIGLLPGVGTDGRARFVAWGITAIVPFVLSVAAAAFFAGRRPSCARQAA